MVSLRVPRPLCENCGAGQRSRTPPRHRPALAGEQGATYAIPIIYVPVLMITHFVAFYLLVRPQPKAARALAGHAAAS
jgi:hypothetical protein